MGYDEIKTRFCALWNGLAIEQSWTETVFADVHKSYSEPHRHYHNGEHIADCLGQFDRACSSVATLGAKDRTEIELAIWFHDLVYDPHAADNEERSAQRFVDEERSAQRFVDTVHSLAIDGDAVVRITSLILDTKHNREPQTDNGALLVDIDLSILGRDPETFARYDRQIRQEYDFVPEERYRTRRAEILAGFLARPVLYRTAFFRERYEAQARRNLTEAVARLR